MRKKILFILHLPPPVHGSSMVGKYIKESNTINNTFNCRYINLSTSISVDEIGKKPILKAIRYILILLKIIIELVRFKPKLCYMTITAKGAAFYKDSIAVFLIKLFGVKIVYHMHNKGVAINKDKAFDDYLYKRVFNNSQVILLSQYLYNDIEKYVNIEDVFLCPNGIPEVDYQLENNVENTESKVRILFLSNLIESKGIYILLEACKLLDDRELNFYCDFVGGEADINKTIFEKKVKELNLDNKVKYLGKQYADDKISTFKNSDIFAFPTFYHNETFGLVNLEAMQYNLPIVSTFEGGIPDVVEDGVNGFLVKQRDIVDLANKLEVLIQDKDLRMEMGIAGRKKYEREFTLDIFEKRLKDILMKIVYA